MQTIPRSVTEKLAYYVYAYVRTSDEQIRYVGKGKGQRALAHLLRLKRHRVDILSHSLPDAATAYALETAIIDALSLKRLSNKVRGKGSRSVGRSPLKELVLRYGARPSRFASLPS